MTHRIIHGDCLAALQQGGSEKIHSVVCDPPYGLSREPDIEQVLSKWIAGEDYEHRGRGFMGKEWDSFVPGPAVWREVYRVLKPGGHALVFAGTRTADLMGIALRMAGFEIRDEIMWIQGQGAPKSHNIGKMIDKQAGYERERVESNGGIPPGSNQLVQSAEQNARATDMVSDVPMTAEGAEWNGWGTTLKPAHEPIIIARKPIGRCQHVTPTGRQSTRLMTVAENILVHRVGGYNIDGCMIDHDELPREIVRGERTTEDGYNFNRGAGRMPGTVLNTGRHPANVIVGHDEYCVETAGGVYLCHPRCAVRLLDSQAWKNRKGVSRFFFTPKASTSERNAGLEALVAAFAPTMGSGFGAREHNPDAPGALVKNTHPTVKPIELMRYLCRLVTPPAGIVLDPYMGSGTTGIAALLEGYTFIGMEKVDEYIPIAAARIAHWAPESSGQVVTGPVATPPAQVDEPGMIEAIIEDDDQVAVTPTYVQEVAAAHGLEITAGAPA